jgi:hypothetical protein
MDLRPLTAREALWLIRYELAQPILDSETSQRLDRIAAQGLDMSAPQNFELSDQLADRLAEAHGLLARIERVELLSPSQGLDLRGEIRGALALPPDLEAMVERRIRLERR